MCICVCICSCVTVGVGVGVGVCACACIISHTFLMKGVVTKCLKIITFDNDVTEAAAAATATW